MPRIQRSQYSGSFHHVYNRGVAKCPIVSDDIDRKVFMQILGDNVSHMSFRLIAYCLMDNHFHLFLQQKEESFSLSVFMRELGRKYARFFNNRYDRVGPLFQNRFRSRPVGTDIYAKVLLRYIHQNPLSAKLTHQLSSYAWSSYACYVGALPQWPWLDTNWGLSLFDKDPKLAVSQFIRFHTLPPSDHEIKRLSDMRQQLFMPA